MIERDAEGHWLGSGNPHGRPRGAVSITPILHEILATKDPKTGKTKAYMVAQALVTLAASHRSLPAIVEIMNRIDGKVIERHSLEGTLPVTLVFRPARELNGQSDKQEIVEATEVKELEAPRETKEG